MPFEGTATRLKRNVLIVAQLATLPSFTLWVLKKYSRFDNALAIASARGMATYIILSTPISASVQEQNWVPHTGGWFLALSC